MFPQAPPRPAGGRLELIYVGGWSLRKGCDLLTAAIRAVDGVRLTHVGPLGDLAFPAGDARFVHVAPVSQDQLGGYYQQADGVVLASREEGLSLVLAQALASGLPVICTDRTGGEDLAWTPALADRISVVPTDDPAALAAAIEAARDRALAGGPPRLLSESDRETLSWAAYGRRYNDEIARDFTR